MSKPPFIVHDHVRRITVGIRIDDTGDVFIATALCNPADRFVKRLGYTKVLGRLREGGLQPLGCVNPERWKAKVLPIIRRWLKNQSSEAARTIGRDRMLKDVSIALYKASAFPCGA